MCSLQNAHGLAIKIKIRFSSLTVTFQPTVVFPHTEFSGSLTPPAYPVRNDSCGLQTGTVHYSSCSLEDTVTDWAFSTAEL